MLIPRSVTSPEDHRSHFVISTRSPVAGSLMLSAVGDTVTGAARSARLSFSTRVVKIGAAFPGGAATPVDWYPVIKRIVSINTTTAEFCFCILVLLFLIVPVHNLVLSRAITVAYTSFISVAMPPCQGCPAGLGLPILVPSIPPVLAVIESAVSPSSSQLDRASIHRW